VRKKFITNYYKGLFGKPGSNNFSMIESFTSDIIQVSQLERRLRRQFFKWSIIKLEDLTGSRPSSTKFIFWELIKDNLMPLFSEFHKGNIFLFCLNFGIITLLPMQKEATQIQQFRPIFVLKYELQNFYKSDG
jgi:hypothetical protein